MYKFRTPFGDIVRFWKGGVVVIFTPEITLRGLKRKIFIEIGSSLKLNRI